jgi:GIY-YIG catalytic domain
MATSGVYLIRHRTSPSCYVGQAINVEARWNEHKRALRKPEARGWYRHAPSRDPADYHFEILEIVEQREERAQAEMKWAAHFVKEGCVLFNVAPTGNLAPDGEGLPVCNLDTGDIYPSAAEASRLLGLSGDINFACRFVRLACGHRWAFVGEEEAQLEKYQQAALGNAVDRPFPRKGTSAYRIWSTLIELNNPSNAELYAALPDEKRSQVSTEAGECRRTHGWTTR